MSDVLVTIRDLRVTLGGNKILNGLHAHLRRGQITALMGMNGSGKTTLLKALLKEVPYQGDIIFHCGHNHQKPMPNHIGYVPQKLQIDARMPLTVRDLMALALQRWPLFLGVTRKSQHIMNELLDRVWSRHLMDRPVEKISGGELQKVLLALALYPEPELLLLDEPAQGVDYQHQGKFYQLIAGLNRELGVTIVLVSHELSVVTEHAHHVLCLKDGLIKCQGHPREIMTGENLANTFGPEQGVYAHRH